MASLSDVLSTLQNGVVAINNFGTQIKGSFNNLLSQLGVHTTNIATINAQLLLLAPLASPAFTGVPTAPTAAALNNSTQLATTAYVDGAVSGIPATFASGTVLLFYQTAAPTGWTKVVTQNDKALRVVSGAGGVSGGTNAFSTVMAQTVVGGTAISIAQMPSHTHTYNSPASSGGTAGADATAGAVSAGTATGSQGSGSTHNHTITMSIQYIDIILCSKN